MLVCLSVRFYKHKMQFKIRFS